MKLSDVFTDLGEFGPFQKRFCCLICLLQLTQTFPFLGNVFLLAVPKHRCAIPGLENDTFKSQGSWHDELVNQTIPWVGEKNMFSQCDIFMQDLTQDKRTNRTIQCDKWVYDQEIFYSTFVTETNLVCDRLMYKTYANMASMAGILCGSFVLGALSDMIGRKKVFIVSLIGCCSVMVANGFVRTFIPFVVLKFFTSFFAIGYYLSIYVLAMEMVGPGKRKFVASTINMFWCAGVMLIPCSAYFLRDWQHLQMAWSFPHVLFSIYFFILPESPSWLFSKGKLEELSLLIKRIAKINKVTLSEKMFNLQELETKTEGGKIWHMLTVPTLLIRCLVIFFNWSVCSMAYYGLTLNAGNMGGSIFINFFLSGAVEAASTVICFLLLDRIGRKLLQCSTMLVAGAFCVCTLFPILFGDKDVYWITIVLSLVGKCGVTAGFSVIYIFTAELFPTVMRNSGMGISSVMARVGGILAPFIADIGNVITGDMATALPLLIFGGTSIAAGLLALLLPETANKMLPDTVEDAKNFGRKKTRDNKYDMNYYNTSSSNISEDSEKYNPSFEE